MEQERDYYVRDIDQGNTTDNKVVEFVHLWLGFKKNYVQFHTSKRILLVLKTAKKGECKKNTNIFLKK